MKQSRPIIALFLLMMLSIAVARGNGLPNVVMFMADDLGWSDIAAYRRHQGLDEPIPTPNLDRICAEGMMFTDAYSAAGLCAPTRFSMMTGSNPQRNGMPGGTWGFTATSAFSNGRKHVTVGEIAQSANYRTAFFGKMHFGGGSTSYESVMPKFPTTYGFDYTFCTHGGIQDAPYLYFENDRFVKIDAADPLNPSMPGMMSDLVEWAAGNYSITNGTGNIKTDHGGTGDANWNSSQNGIINSRKAAAFIDDHLANHSGQPFMLYYCSPQVHTPHTPPIDFEPNSDGTPGIPVNMPVAGVVPGGNSHSDIIHEIDLQVGWILNKLEDPNGDGNLSDSILDNTLFMFTSDNGGLGPNHVPSGYDSTGALRGAKGSAYEGGHRVPFVARWPGMIATNSVSSQLIGGHDWVGVMYGLTSNSMAADQAMDCVNILPTLLGEQSENAPHRDFMILHLNDTPYVIRQGDYVLFLNESRVPTKLYNLATDLEQVNDLFNEPSEQQRISDMEVLFKLHDEKNDPRSTPAYVAPDIHPPSPNPPTFLSVPEAVGSSVIGMVAETGADFTGPVEYFFDETSGHEGGSDSEWQLSPIYTDDKLLPGLTYSYSVQMRDALGHTGSVSATFYATPSTNGFSSLFMDDFEASSESGNQTAPYPVGIWHHQGTDAWALDGQAGSSVQIGDYASGGGNELRIGWGYDEVVSLYSISASIDTNLTYTFDGNWEVGAVKSLHRGFIAGLAEFSSADGSLVQRLTPDTELFGKTTEPVVGESGTFAVSITPAELVAVGVTPGNRIGIFLHHDDGAPLYDEGSEVNDVYLIDDVELIAEGEAKSIFSQWLINHGVVGATNDPDGDGANNLLEFSRGGIPSDKNSLGHLPEFGMSEGKLLFVYPERINSGLTYRLETNTNLFSNDWVTAGYTELSGIRSIDADFVGISNSIPITNSQLFVRLLVEE